MSEYKPSFRERYAGPLSDLREMLGNVAVAATALFVVSNPTAQELLAKPGEVVMAGVDAGGEDLQRTAFDIYDGAITRIESTGIDTGELDLTPLDCEQWPDDPMLRGYAVYCAE